MGAQILGVVNPHPNTRVTLVDNGIKISVTTRLKEDEVFAAIELINRRQYTRQGIVFTVTKSANGNNVLKARCFIFSAQIKKELVNKYIQLLVLNLKIVKRKLRRYVCLKEIEELENKILSIN